MLAHDLDRKACGEAGMVLEQDALPACTAAAAATASISRAGSRMLAVLEPVQQETKQQCSKEHYTREATASTAFHSCWISSKSDGSTTPQVAVCSCQAAGHAHARLFCTQHHDGNEAISPCCFALSPTSMPAQLQRRQGIHNVVVNHNLLN